MTLLLGEYPFLKLSKASSLCCYFFTFDSLKDKYFFYDSLAADFKV